MRIIRVMLVGGLLSVGAACASRTTQQASGGEVDFSDAIAVEVTNDNFNDVTVYAVASGVSTRLGTVGGNSRATLSLRTSIVPTGTVRLVADPIGGGGQGASGQLPVTRGSSILFRIAPVITQSSATVR